LVEIMIRQQQSDQEELDRESKNDVIFFLYWSNLMIAEMNFFYFLFFQIGYDLFLSHTFIKNSKIKLQLDIICYKKS
jgi:hypothetical protein